MRGTQIIDGVSASFFHRGTARYVIPCDADWDKRLFGHRLELYVLDESDVAGDSYLGIAYLLLAPLCEYLLQIKLFPHLSRFGMPMRFVISTDFWQLFSECFFHVQCLGVESRQP
jgi:hypothetical protein